MLHCKKGGFYGKGSGKPPFFGGCIFWKSKMTKHHKLICNFFVFFAKPIVQFAKKWYSIFIQSRRRDANGEGAFG